MHRSDETEFFFYMFFSNKFEEDIIEYLNENLNKIDIHARCSYKNTFLILAANRKYSKLVTKFINLGVDIHAKNVHGITVFSSLTADGDNDNLKFLIKKGGMININNKSRNFLSPMVYYQRLETTLLVINHLAKSPNAKYKLKLLRKELDKRLDEIKLKDTNEYIEKTKKYVNIAKKEIDKLTY